MKIEDLITRASEKIDEKLFDDALVYVKEAIELSPDYARAYSVRGIIKNLKGDLKGGMADLDNAISLKPNYYAAYVNRSQIKATLRDFKGAISDLDNAIRFGKSESDAATQLNKSESDVAIRFNKLKSDAIHFYNRGWFKENIGNHIGAIVDYEEAIHIEPDFIDAYNNRGNAKKNLGFLDSAIADYDRTIKLKPDYAEIYSNRGDAKRLKGDLTGAADDIAFSIHLNPDYGAAYLYLGMVRMDQGDLTNALCCFDKSIGLNPRYAEAYVSRGNAKMANRDLRGALADYDVAIKLKPDFAGAYHGRGVVKGSQGSLDGALSDYELAIRFDPNYAGSYYNRAAVKQLMGDLKGAIDDLNEAIKFDRGNAMFYYTRGEVKQAMGNHLEAKADLDRAMQISPAPAFFYFAFAQGARGIQETQLKEAYSIYQSILNVYEALAGEASREVSYMHFTNLDTMHHLAHGEKFRLYCSENMEDEREGKALFEMLYENVEVRKKIMDYFDCKHESSAYIGSIVTDSNPDVGDKSMWDTYGKDNDINGAGCAIVFDKENFPDFPTLKTVLQHTWYVSAGKAGEAVQIVAEECFVCPVVYDNGKVPAKIRDAVRALGIELSYLCDKYKKSEKIIVLVNILLDYIRYLFKHREFSRESEARMVVWRPQDEQGMVVKRDQKKLEKKYVECPRALLKNVRIILGPAVRNADELKLRLDDKGVFEEVKKAK